MYRTLLKLVKTQTAKDASVMTIGTAAGAVLAAGFFIVAARILGPEKLGIFSLATAASFMLADIFDIALNTSLIRFVAAELSRESGKEEKFLKLIFKIKLAVGVVLLLSIALLATPLSKLIFGRPMPEVLLLIGLGTGFQLIFTFGITHLQARKKFNKAAAGLIMLPGLRLLGILGLLVVRSIETLSSLAVYFFATPIAAVTMMFLAPAGFFKVKGESEVAKKLLRYNLPLTAGFAIAAIGGRIDNFIIANIMGSAAVGFYSAAFRLFAPIQFLAGSLATVFAPRFAGFEKLQEAKTYFKKTILAISLASIALLCFLPFSRFFIKLFFGNDFLPSVSVLRILFFGFAVFLLQVPFTSSILYYFAKSRVFALISGCQLVLIVTANLLLVPKFHENGAAFAFLLTQLIVLALLISYSFIQFQKTQE